MRRNLLAVLVALIAGSAALVIADSSAGAGSPVRWGYINSGQESPLLVGMSLSRAEIVAKRHHFKLDVLRVFEDAPKGTITEEPHGLPGSLSLVVSKGRPRSLWSVLLGAKGIPVHEECAPRFDIDVDANGIPATCEGSE